MLTLLVHSAIVWRRTSGSNCRGSPGMLRCMAACKGHQGCRQLRDAAQCSATNKRCPDEHDDSDVGHEGVHKRALVAWGGEYDASNSPVAHKHPGEVVANKVVCHVFDRPRALTNESQNGQSQGGPAPHGKEQNTAIINSRVMLS